MGRQGRNGKKGMVVDIYNYDNIKREYEQFENSTSYSELLQIIYDEEQYILNQKLQKHKTLESRKWEWLEQDKDNKAMYLKSRTVERLKFATIKDANYFQDEYENLIAQLSGNVASVLNEQSYNSNFDKTEFKDDWFEMSDKVQLHWSNHLANTHKENGLSYFFFLLKVRIEWSRLSALHQSLSPTFENEFTSKLMNRIAQYLKEDVKHITYFCNQFTKPLLEAIESVPLNPDDKSNIKRFY